LGSKPAVGTSRIKFRSVGLHSFARSQSVALLFLSLDPSDDLGWNWQKLF
jgi:hypothetical protein